MRTFYNLGGLFGGGGDSGPSDADLDRREREAREEAARKQRALAAGARGKGSTLLTPGGSQTAPTGKRSLLGTSNV